MNMSGSSQWVDDDNSARLATSIGWLAGACAKNEASPVTHHSLIAVSATHDASRHQAISHTRPFQGFRYDGKFLRLKPSTVPFRPGGAMVLVPAISQQSIVRPRPSWAANSPLKGRLRIRSV